MAFEEITALLGGWPGFVIERVAREPGEPDASAPQITIALVAVPDTPRTCSRCGQTTTAVHDVSPRRVRELPILDAETWLLVPLARVRCPTCGPTVERLPWLDRYARMTTRFAASVARLAQVLPIQQVAAWFGLSWDTVQAIDHAAMAARLGPITPHTLAGVRRIVIDEFALHKGRRYATVVAEPDTREVLWVGRGRTREDLRAFFELLGPAGCAALEVAVMDMNGAYEVETRAQCPQAAIVYDLFHVLAKYGREVIDRVRLEVPLVVREPLDRQRRHAPAGLAMLPCGLLHPLAHQVDELLVDGQEPVADRQLAPAGNLPLPLQPIPDLVDAVLPVALVGLAAEDRADHLVREDVAPVQVRRQRVERLDHRRDPLIFLEH